jgi:circadian clock protein KaiB
MKPKTVKRRAAGGESRDARTERAGQAPATAAPGRAASFAGALVARKVKRAKALARRRPAERWQLRLYVMDATRQSQTALANLKRFCETYLKRRFRITVIDLQKHPHLAKGDQILAIPTVVRQLPKPARTIIGDLSDSERMLIGLDLRAAD